MNNKRKLLLALALIFILNIAVITMASPSASAVAYKQGSTGSKVKEIQQKLLDWGYYRGEVDGVYGSKTTEAVKYFQRENGLTADGIAGDATLRELGLGTAASAGGSGGSDSNEVEMLARLISAEARGEPYSGQVAVGAVVMNRVEHPSFPNTMSGVIYQKGAFSCLDDGQWNEPWRIPPTRLPARH